MDRIFGNVKKNIYNHENFSRLDQGKKLDAIKKLKDPLVFARDLLGIQLFDYQQELLVCEEERVHVRKGRQVGASLTLALKCVIWTILHPGITVAVISPSQRQSSLVFKYIRDIFMAHEMLRLEIAGSETRYSQTVIQLKNDSIIYSLPCGNDGRTIRGISIGKNSIMIVDEAAFIPEKVWEAIDYFTATGGQEIISSTPLGKSGRFYDMSLNESYKHFYIPSSRNPLISKSWLESRKHLRSYTNEILAEFMAGEGKFFDADLIRSIINAELSWNESPLHSAERFKSMGIDIGLERDPTVITICKKLEKYVPIFIQAYKKKNDKDSYKIEEGFQAVTSYGEIVKETINLKNKYDVNYAAIDATNNAYVAESCENDMQVYPIKFNSTAKNGNPMKSELMHTLLAGMSTGKIQIPNHRDLVRQLYNYEYEITENKNEKFSSIDEDFIDSLALCLYTELAIQEPDNFAIA